MLGLQRHHGCAQFDPEVRGPIRDTIVQASKSLGTCGIHAVSRPGSLGPLDVVEQLATLRAISPRSAPIITPRRISLRHDSPAADVSVDCVPRSRTSASSGVPVGNTAAAPASSSFGTSACGMVPPTTTAMSPASAARSASTVRVVSATCAPDRIESPTTRNIFLQRDRHDVLDALPDTGVDHLETGVAQRARDDLGAAVMAVEAGLGDQHAGRGHSEHHRLLELAPHRS